MTEPRFISPTDAATVLGVSRSTVYELVARGDLPGTAREALHVALERAGLPQVRLHDLRHSYASIYLRMPNASIKKLSEYMGHSSIVTTLRIYAHCIPAMDEEAAAWMDQQVLGGSVTNGPITS